MLFYFFRTKIKNRLYKIYKAFLFNKKKFFQKKYYPIPFIYEPRTHNKGHKRRKVDAQHLSFQLVRLFYIMYSYKQLHKLIKKAKRSDAVFEHTFMRLMECKLPSFIYRSSFFSNMFESISFVKSGNL
jgi:ribosomal protein S4